MDLARFPVIISAAASSPLGIAALVILVLGSIALAFFRGTHPKLRLLGFGALVAGLAVLLAVIGLLWHAPPGLSAPSAAAASVPWQKHWVNRTANLNWQTTLENFLDGTRPQFGSITGSVSGDADFHLWARADGNGPVWRVRSVLADNTNDWESLIARGAARSEVFVIGFVNYPPNRIYYLEASAR